MIKKILKLVCTSFLIYNCTNINAKNMKNSNEGLLVQNETEENALLSDTSNNDKSKICSDCDSGQKEYVTYILKNKNDSIEYEVDLNNVDECIKKYLDERKIRKLKRVEKSEEKYGKKNIRFHWDIEFRKKCKEEVSLDFETFDDQNEENETLFLEKGKLKIADWLRIKDQSIIQNLDPIYLDKSEKWPPRYYNLLRYNKCKRSGLLSLSIISGCIILFSYIGVETFFILKSYTNVDYILPAAFFGIFGAYLILVSIGALLINKYLLALENEYQIIIYEPSKCAKTLYCMQPKKNSVMGSYKCCGCFNYPGCLYYMCSDIKKCINYLCSSISKLMGCKKKEIPIIKVELSKKKILEEEYTIDLKVGEKTDVLNV